MSLERVLAWFMAVLAVAASPFIGWAVACAKRGEGWDLVDAVVAAWVAAGFCGWSFGLCSWALVYAGPEAQDAMRPQVLE